MFFFPPPPLLYKAAGLYGINIVVTKACLKDLHRAESFSVALVIRICEKISYLTLKAFWGKVYIIHGYSQKEKKKTHTQKSINSWLNPIGGITVFQFVEVKKKKKKG